MNKKILKFIINNKEKLIPLIFTIKQIQVIEKYLKQEKLSNADKKALYTSITKKVKLLELTIQEKEETYFIKGHQKIIQSRINKAKKILKEYKAKKIFIAGSFLFSRKYNDVDIYIIREKGYKEIYKENRHLIYLTEKKLKEPIFQSASLISVSNFNNTKKYQYKHPFLHELMGLYHESVIELRQNNTKKEAVRDLIFTYYTSKNKLIDALELKQLIKNTNLAKIDLLFAELCKQIYSKNYLYNEFHNYIKTLKQAIHNTQQNKHLIQYKTNYEEMIYGKKRNKARAY